MEDRALTKEEERQFFRLLGRWLLRCRVAQSAYNDATTRAVAIEHRLGVPAVGLSALVATGVFATLTQDPSLGWRIVTGIVAVGAALLTALQTFLRQAERAEQYREAARSYGRLRRRIEQLMAFPPVTKRQAEEVLDAIAEALAEAARGKPNVPQRVWDRADYRVKGTSDARGVRALRLRLRERLDFGVGQRDAEPLVEDHQRYFCDLDAATFVPIARVRPTTPRHADPASVAAARTRMREAAAGTRMRRPPLDVREDADGGYVLVDGNATFAVAEQDGWNMVPVNLMPASAGEVHVPKA